MKNKRLILLSIAGIIFMIPFLPFLVFGQDVYFTYNDILDSNHVLYAIMGGQIPGAELQNGIYPSVMGGLPSSCFPSSCSVIALIYSIVSPFLAYIINLLLIRLIAFGGMYFLLPKLFPGSPFLLQITVALCFSLIPFFPFAGISVAGLPFLLLSLLILKENPKDWKAWLYLLAFPFYSNLVWVGITILLVLSGWFLYILLRERKIVWPFIFALIFLSCSYLITEYAVIKDTILDQAYVSQRIEFSMASFMEPVSFPWGVLIGWDQFLFAQEHSLSLHYPVIILLLPVTCILFIIDKSSRNKSFILLLLVTGLISLFYGILFWTPLAKFMEQFSIFRLIDPGRFYFLQPLLWYLLLFKACYILLRKGGWYRYLVLGILPVQICFLLGSNVQVQTFLKEDPPQGTVSYRAFYSSSVYARIKTIVFPLKKEDKFGCLGIYPGIPQFNGLPTIDGYVSNYPLSYKKEFREIISGELEKDISLRKYFDHWGSRCYLFNQQTGKDFLVQQNKAENYKNLDLNFEKLNSLNCRYILSALPINECESLGFHFMGEFQDPNHPYKVFLYVVSTPG